MTSGGATPGRRWVLAGTVLAWTALVVFVVGLGLALAPVQNRVDGRTAQDCGTPAAFVLSGRQEVRFGSGGKTGLTSRQAASANRHGCRSLVARRAIPAGGFLLATLLVGGVAFAITIKGRSGDGTDTAATEARVAGVGPAHDQRRPWGAPTSR